MSSVSVLFLFFFFFFLPESMSSVSVLHLPFSQVSTVHTPLLQDFVREVDQPPLEEAEAEAEAALAQGIPALQSRASAIPIKARARWFIMAWLASFRRWISSASVRLA